MSSKSQYRAEIEIQNTENEKLKRVINFYKSKINQLEIKNKNLENERNRLLKELEIKNKNKSWLNMILSLLQNHLRRN